MRECSSELEGEFESRLLLRESGLRVCGGVGARGLKSAEAECGLAAEENRWYGGDQHVLRGGAEPEQTEAGGGLDSGAERVELEVR